MNKIDQFSYGSIVEIFKTLKNNSNSDIKALESLEDQFDTIKNIEKDFNWFKEYMNNGQIKNIEGTLNVLKKDFLITLNYAQNSIMDIT